MVTSKHYHKRLTTRSRKRANSLARQSTKSANAIQEQLINELKLHVLRLHKHFLKRIYLMISVPDSGKLAGRRVEFHKLLVRCRFVLPSTKSEAATLSWMYEVF
jgi:hypothetical protein